MSASKDDLNMDVDAGTSDSAKNIATMDTNDTERNVMASGTAGSVTCSLHPLVIMNVSEHWTRDRAQNSIQIPGAPAAAPTSRPGGNITLFLFIYYIFFCKVTLIISSIKILFYICPYTSR